MSTPGSIKLVLTPVVTLCRRAGTRFKTIDWVGAMIGRMAAVRKASDTTSGSAIRMSGRIGTRGTDVLPWQFNRVVARSDPDVECR
jgi:hypothetical protein